MSIKKSSKSKTVKSKTKSNKKPAAKKTAKKTTSKKTPPQINELVKLVETLEKSEVEQLINQAKILIHNKAVIKSYNENKEKRAKAAKTKAGISTAKKSSKVEIEIREGKNNSFFTIRINGKGKTYTLEEMKKLVKFSHSSTLAESSKKIYSWMGRERPDAIDDYIIEGPSDKKLAELAKILKNTYSA